MNDLNELGGVLRRLAHMAEYAANLSQWSRQLFVTAIALDNLAEEEPVATTGEILRQAAADARAGSEAAAAAATTTGEAIQSAINRLGDNATADDIAAAVSDLEAAKTANAAALAAAASGADLANTIDPDAPDGGGVVEDPENPGEVIPVEPTPEG